MKKIVLINLLFLSHFVSLGQQIPDQVATQANLNYQKSRFQDAISLYNQVLKMGYESSNLYYNIGNAYYKIKDYTSAVYYYEKALKLEPGNSDARFNLILANSSIPDKIDSLPQLFFKKWWNNLLESYSLDEFAIGIIVFFITALLIFATFLVTRVRIVKQFAFWLGMLTLLLAATAGLAAISQQNRIKVNSSAIIFTSTVSVKSSPDAISTDLFVIHEGTKVELLDSLGDWNEIKIANGSKGWIKKEDYKKI